MVFSGRERTGGSLRPAGAWSLALAAAIALAPLGAAARGSPGCSAGRICAKDEVNMVIASDAIRTDFRNNQGRSFYPNCRAEGPSRGASQELVWGEMLAYGEIPLGRLKATLNPDFTSTTTMESRQQTGFPFFPADQTVNLYLQFEVEFGGMLFNKDPIVLKSDVPMNGFPPAFGPDYVSETGVDLFDIADPDGPPIFRFEMPSVTGEVEHLFQAELVHEGGGEFEAQFSTRVPGPPVPARLFIGVTPDLVPTELWSTVVMLSETPITLSGDVELPTEPCFDYFEVWAVSMDPNRPGFGVDMIRLPNDPSCIPPAQLANAGPHESAKPGETIQLSGSGQTQAGPVNFCWVPPTGVVLDDPTSATPSFVAPPTTIDRELLFTLFVDDGTNISAPDRTIVTLAPEAGGAGPVALLCIAALAGRARRRR